MIKHTPGPWHIEGQDIVDDNRLWLITRTISTDDEAIAAVDEANARLIAAAPDLLAALKQLVTDYGDCLMSDVPGPTDADGLAVFAAARAAIAKAEGEP